MNLSNLAKTLLNGKTEAKYLVISKLDQRNWWSIYRDMIVQYLRYGILPTQYTNNRIYKLIGNERKEVCKKICKQNKEKNDWNRLYRSNWRFMAKWSKEKYSGRPYLSYLRAKAYQRHYHLPNYPMIQYGVQIICEHYCVGKLIIGKKVLLARNVDLDYTGDLIIEDGVSLSEGVKILTHNHDLYPKDSEDYSDECIPTPLIIRDHVWMGAKVCILPGVGEIGRSSIISVGAVVRNRVPPYAIMAGNPAKIVGFIYSPDEVRKYEEKRYPDSNKTDLSKYEREYNKLFINRSTFIKEHLKN